MAFLDPVFHTWSLLRNSASIFVPTRKILRVTDSVDAYDDTDRTRFKVNQTALNFRTLGGKPTPVAGVGQLYARTQLPLLRGSNAAADWLFGFGMAYGVKTGWSVTVPANDFSTTTIAPTDGVFDPLSIVIVSSVSVLGIFVQAEVTDWDEVTISLINSTGSPIAFSPVPDIHVAVLPRFVQTAHVPIAADKTSGNAEKSRYLGEVWEAVTAPGVDVVTMVYVDGRYVAIKTTGATVVSTDRGVTWTAAGSLGTAVSEWRSATVIGSRIVVTEYSSGIAKYSDDYAATWSMCGDWSGAISDISRLACVTLSTGAKRLVGLALSSGNTCKSDNNGLSWSSGGSLGAGTRRYLKGIETRLVAIRDTGAVKYSDDGGATWTTGPSSLGAASWNAGCVADARILAIVPSTGTVAYSDDWGMTWSAGASLGAGNWSAVA